MSICISVLPLLQFNCFIVRPVFKSQLTICELGKLLGILGLASICNLGWHLVSP